MRSGNRACATILCCLALASGCGKSESPTGGGNAGVQCRVVVVLKPGESIGGATNMGCRLSSPQILQYMQALNNYGSKYGNNASFVYNSTPVEWDSPSIQGRDMDLLGWFSTDVNEDSPQHDTGYDDQKINIYFVGHVVDGTTNQYNGNTVDPLDSAECPALAVRPHIFITDRSTNAGDPAFVNTSEHVLEHEMCHFLIREKRNRQPWIIGGMTICAAQSAQGSGRYDVLEHDLTPDVNHLLLMRPHSPHGQMQPVDTVETSGRVINNRFLLP